MTSTHAVDLTLILQDPSIALPLLRVLYVFDKARTDPFSLAEAKDIMLQVWTKVPECEEGMLRFLIELSQKVAA